VGKSVGESVGESVCGGAVVSQGNGVLRSGMARERPVSGGWVGTRTCDRRGDQPALRAAVLLTTCLGTRCEGSAREGFQVL